MIRLFIVENYFTPGSKITFSQIFFPPWSAITHRTAFTDIFSLGLAGLELCREIRSCHARHHNDREGDNNFSRTIYSFRVLCLEHHYCGDQ